jgi:hypothetical protein
MGILGVLFNILAGSGGQASPDRANSGVQARPQPGGFPPKQRFFCKYCGVGYSNVWDLTVNVCLRHPTGRNRHREPAL